MLNSLQVMHQWIEVVPLLFLEFPYVEVQHKVQFMTYLHVLL